MEAWATASLFLVYLCLVSGYTAQYPTRNIRQLLPNKSYKSSDRDVLKGPTPVPAQSAVYSEHKYQIPDNQYYNYQNYDQRYQETQAKWNPVIKPSDNFEQSIEAAFTNEDFEKDIGGYTQYKASNQINYESPYQMETINSKSYHKSVPAFDVSEFHQPSMQKHGEVHYHQHKHMHKHEHKQEHHHQHKQDHKHQHGHKHEHHQEHKHEHHQQHKHEHHQEHKHSHHHGHKHEHHQEHKHHHKHGHDHKHEHKQEHHHKHHNEHKHDHHHGHKHHSEHKHSHHNEHKHHHKHHGEHKHDHHHGHKHISHGKH